jgi:hypothetical protein
MCQFSITTDGIHDELEPPRSEPDPTASVIIDFNYTYRSVCTRRAHRPLCSFPHVERVHLSFETSVDLCYNDSKTEKEREREGGVGGGRRKKRADNATEPTDTIFIYCRVCLCLIMPRRGESGGGGGREGGRGGKKRRRKESCIQMKECRGRWDGVG